MKTIKVIYIAGSGRSGSTILDRVLGSLEGVFSLNEIYRIWQDGFIENNLCSCGKPFTVCPFWSAVVADAIKDQSHIGRHFALSSGVEHSRHFPGLYTGMTSKKFKAKVEDYTEILRKLFFAIAKFSGEEIIVDSSKIPSRALILSRVPGIEVHILHVVRDVRAVVHAWQKNKYNPARRVSMRRYPAYRTIFFWIMRNAFSELLSSKLPYVRVSYEDFASNPRGTLQSVVDRIQPVRGQRLPFTKDNSIYLEPVHSISGNPQRFSFGVTTLRLDDEWRLNLDPMTRKLAYLFAYPLNARYGYTKSGNFGKSVV